MSNEITSAAKGQRKPTASCLALEERVALYRRMADRASNGNRGATAEAFQRRADHSDENARVLRQFLLDTNREVEA